MTGEQVGPGPVRVNVGASDLVELTRAESRALAVALAGVTNTVELARAFDRAGTQAPVEAGAVGTLDALLAVIAFWRRDAGSLPDGVERLYDAGIAVQLGRRRPNDPA